VSPNVSVAVGFVVISKVDPSLLCFAAMPILFTEVALTVTSKDYVQLMKMQ